MMEIYNWSNLSELYGKGKKNKRTRRGEQATQKSPRR